MADRISLRPTESDFEWWIERFVPNPMLWWWDDSDIPNESIAQRIMDRKEGRGDSLVGDITYVNSFHTWAMHEDVTRIIIDDGAWIQSLLDDERQAASDRQVRLNRGLCIPVQRFGDDIELPDSVLSNGRVVLDQALWETMQDEVKHKVVEAELADFDGDSTHRLPDGTPPHIAEIVNGFVLQEGVNCLSVAAFAVTADREDLLQWLFPAGFEGILRKYGYVDVDESIPKGGDIIVFRDDEKNIVHAAHVMEPDRILNKNGQSSFNPITITDLATLEGEWHGYGLAVYRQESTGTRGHGDGPATTT